MSPFRLLLLSSFALMLLAAPLTAGPAGQLKRAIDKDETQATDPSAIADIVAKADRLLKLKHYSKAISLYEKAYELAPGDQDAYLRLLGAKRAAGRITQQEREALALLEEDKAALIAHAFRMARLRILQARQALRAKDAPMARAHVQAGLAVLKALPNDVDVAPYSRELNALSTAASRRHGQTKTPQPPVPDVAVVDDAVIPDSIAPRQDDETLLLGEADPLDVETGDIIDVDAVLDEDYERHAYDRAVTTALRRARADLLIDNNVAAMPIPGMTFPGDWAEKTRKRARCRDGVIYESKPFKGEDGQTYTTVIYDLGDLVHPVPNFYSDYPGSVRRQRMETLDRYYLRERSMIFNGYPQDLAAGMPLLHFFGGIDNHAIPTRTDAQETQRIVRTLELFLASP